MKIRQFAIEDYQLMWQKMLDFTENRTTQTEDELWVLQHYSVFTQGKAGDAKHLFHLGDIPLISTDRGGQITYHGEGQLIIYLLIDLTRRGLGVKKLVHIIEQSLINLLNGYQIQASLKENAPGVYVGSDKIASLGLRIKHGCSLHGLSLNVDMDLSPFSQIRPCGLSDVGVTQIKNFHKKVDFKMTADTLTQILIDKLSDNVQ